MKHKHYEFLANLPKTDLKPIYLITGAENYLKEQVLKAIIRRGNFHKSDDFDFITINAFDKPSPADVLQNLEALPFLAEKRIVIIKDYDSLLIRNKEILAEYSEKPLSSTVLILVATKPDLRKKNEKKLIKNSCCIDCAAPKSVRDINNWLTQEVRRRKLRINDATINMFSQFLEQDYFIAANELDKLELLLGKEKQISLDDIKKSLGRSRTRSVFELQNALGKRNKKLSMQLLENIFEAEPDAGVYIIVMLNRYFKIIWKIRALAKTGLSAFDIEKNYLPEVFAFFRKDYIAAARLYKYEEIENIFASLLKADTLLKTSDTKHLLIVQNAVMNILIKNY